MGGHPELRRLLDERIARGDAFDDETNEQLYEQFFSNIRLSAQMMATGERIVSLALVEDEGALIERLHTIPKLERLRAIEPISLETRVAAHAAAVTILDAPVLCVGRLELRWYLREQTVGRVVHRYGNVMNTARASN